MQTHERNIFDQIIQIYMWLALKRFEFFKNNYTKTILIKLNIYIFNAFVIKILIIN